MRKSLPFLIPLALVAATFGRLYEGAAGAARRAAEDHDRPVGVTAFAPLPDAVPAADGASTDEMVSLGRMLFFEPRLSKSQKISCNSCHDLATYGVDDQPTSDGHKGQMGDRNSPTVFNAAAHFAQFWDGRAPTSRRRPRGPVLNPVEMAMPAEPVVVAVLESMPEYVEALQEGVPERQEAGHLRQHGEGDRRVRAQADDAVALGQVAQAATRRR